MAIFIAEFREKYHLTQAELAVELNISPSLIGKVENLKRKLPDHAQKLLNELEQKYAVENHSSDTSETKTLLDEIKQQAIPGMIGQVEMYVFDCKIEEIKLQKKLKKMNQQLKMYESMIQMATEQLQKASPEDLLTEHFKELSFKKVKAEKEIRTIIHANPPLIALKIIQLQNFINTSKDLPQLTMNNYKALMDFQTKKALPVPETDGPSNI